MNEELSEYYNERAAAIRSSSWSEAFLAMAVCMLGGLLLFVIGEALLTREEAREVALVLIGIGAGYLALRYAIVVYRIRQLKLYVARRAMLE